MEVRLRELAAAVESVARKLKAAGERKWAPVLDGLASRLRDNDASAVGELLDVVERPDGLGELELGPDNAPYVTAGDVGTLNRQFREHVGELIFLADQAADQIQGNLFASGPAGPDQPYELQDEPDDEVDLGLSPAPSAGGASSRTLEDRFGPVKTGPKDWFRVAFHGLCGAVIGGVLGLFMAFDPRSHMHWLETIGWPMWHVLIGAAVGMVLFAFWAMRRNWIA